MAADEPKYTVSIEGPGFKHPIQIGANETVAHALENAQVNAEALGVDLLVNGERKDATEVTGEDIKNVERVAAPPKQAALGNE